MGQKSVLVCTYSTNFSCGF